jgi:hypothetical protein
MARGVRGVGWEVNKHADDLQRSAGRIMKPGIRSMTSNLKAGSRLNQRYVRIGADFVFPITVRNTLLVSNISA